MSAQLLRCISEARARKEADGREYAVAFVWKRADLLSGRITDDSLFYYVTPERSLTRAECARVRFRTSDERPPPDPFRPRSFSCD